MSLKMPFFDFYPGKIIGIEVFIEKFKTRTYVGILKRDNGRFVFYYDANYLRMTNVLPLGPEFPLTRQEFFSYELFPSFQDRLPDPNNPAYAEYCTHVGIAVTTTDPIVLLAKFNKGPSSFIFSPIYDSKHNLQNIEKLQKKLGITMQDFAHLFDISLSALQKIKSGSSSGKEVLKLLELYLEVPEALEFKLYQNAKRLHPEKLKMIFKYIEEKKLKSNFWKKLSLAECAYTQKCIQEIKTFSWAKNLIAKVNQVGLIQSSMPLLFETRFAYALYKAGLSIENEYKAGTKGSDIGNSDVDFLITNNNGTKWLIELTSLDESNEIKANTYVTGNFFSFSSVTTFHDETNSSEEVELMKAQRAILSKVFDNKKNRPTKFPVPDSEKHPKEYHVIIIDMRGFVTGSSDRGDYINILFGSNSFKNENDRELFTRYTTDSKTGGKKFIGIFDNDHPDFRAKYLQKRIHGVGFIREINYESGEIQTVLELFRNPNFFENDEDLITIFPLKKDKNYNPDNNPSRYSPP